VGWNWKGENVSGQYDSPASPLAELSISEDESPRLVILSGPSGAGKSSWCLQLAEQATSANFVVGGLISPAVFRDDTKIGIDLVDQPYGQCRRLAVRRGEERDGLKTEQWLLDPTVLAWGNRQLATLPPCDIVILDELGPQELEHGRGLQVGLTLIESRRIPLIVVVVRPNLLPQARKRWPWGEVLMLASDQASANAK
jgi:nucleoside-triphosphatase THEP1